VNDYILQSLFVNVFSGEVGKNFFRAEFISVCLATHGSIFTGDSNGTLLIWSEKSKKAVRGFPHAHECAIKAICLNEEGELNQKFNNRVV